ncbi:MAG: glycosyltransferase family 2 protein [Acidimicrobiales bacterium]
MNCRLPRPLVSVVVCTYNQAGTITRAIDSVLAQDHRPIEIVVVDNGSTDATAAALRLYEGHPEVHVIRHDANEAVTVRLNHAIARTHGPFVSLLYGDDSYTPDKLSTQVAAFEALDDSYGVVYTPGRRHRDSTGEEWEAASLQASGNILVELLDASQRGCFINPISPLVRRACFDQHPFHEDLFVEGEAHYLRIAITHRFQFLSRSTVIMHEHEHNIGKAIRANGVGIVVLLDRLMSDARLATEERQAVRRARARLHRNLGWQSLRVLEDGRWARTQFGKAIRVRPSTALQPKVIVGGALSLLPAAALRRVNRVGYRLHAGREHFSVVDGYR